MKTLYFDCFSGISGDMTIGALIDVGVPFEYLEKDLQKLGINDEYIIEAKKTKKCGIEGTDFYVHLKEHSNHHMDEHHHGRNLFDIETLIDKSELNDNVKKISKDIFKVIADAESKVHGVGLYDVHFHEVGAVDSIIDVVGCAICIDYLKPDHIISSPINTGSGFVKCAHGILPVPAPATLNILKGVPIYSDDVKMELTTPTGAAIIKTLAKKFQKVTETVPYKIGYGCGKRKVEDKPNMLRVIISKDELEENCIFEATIDDMNPEIYGYLMDKLFNAGAKDVYFTPIYMKKNRPGILVTITAPIKSENDIKNVMFTETTTIGIRKFNVERTALKREFKVVQTSFGNVTFKISSYNDKIVNVSPEYEELKIKSERNNIPLKEIYNVVNSDYVKNANK